MSETLHTRIEERIAEMGSNPRAISVAAGLDSGYLRKLLQRRHMPNSACLQAIAEALDLSVSFLLYGKEEGSELPKQRPPSQRRADPQASQRLEVARDLPLRRAVGLLHNITQFHLPLQPAAWLYRPPALADMPATYGFLLPNAGLRPHFAPGDLVVACPERPAARGDAVVVRLATEMEHPICIVGRLEEDVGNEVVIFSHGQASPQRYPAAHVLSVDSILSLAQIMGA